LTKKCISSKPISVSTQNSPEKFENCPIAGGISYLDQWAKRRGRVFAQ